MKPSQEQMDAELALLHEGTPKTLRGAVENGFGPLVTTHEQVVRMEAHVLDKLSQIFTTAMIEGWSLERTWRVIRNNPEQP